uniref:Uncharacterized protein n=1 Tax=Papio anubis TaxID=9555 RepID=A0A2I3N5U9_PAPAN
MYRQRGELLFLGLFLLGQSLDDLLPLGLEALFTALACFLGLRLTISSKQPAQNPHSPHPRDLLWHSVIGCTLPLTYAHVPALPAGQGIFPASRPGMDCHRLADDQPIFDQLSDLLTGVGIGDFIGLIGV